jgi:hypothetical protein
MKLDIVTLNTMSDSELRSLNSAVIAIIKGRNKAKCVAAAQTFTVGSKVSFMGKRGTCTGTVTKVKIKMVEVDCGVQGRWNVAGTLLRPVL